MRIWYVVFFVFYVIVICYVVFSGNIINVIIKFVMDRCIIKVFIFDLYCWFFNKVIKMVKFLDVVKRKR